MRNTKTLILSVVFMGLVVGWLWTKGRPAPPLKTTMEDVRQEAAAGGYALIDTEQMRRRLARGENLLLVDTRQPWEYRTGHIQGAVNFSMEPTWWNRWRSRGALEKFLGPDKSRAIVFY
jgi:3-mercaptopyruvate sulfurtransferase SseA